MPIDVGALAREGARFRVQQMLAELAALERALPGITTRQRTASDSSAPTPADTDAPGLMPIAVNATG